jgi:hypothetical protein
VTPARREPATFPADGQHVPGPLLQSALDYVNDALQRVTDTIQADGQAGLLWWLSDRSQAATDFVNRSV